MDQGIAQKRNDRSLALPVLLIAAGLLLFATNYGWLDWGFLLGLAQFWPVALIAAGLDMLTRGRYRLLVYGGAVVVALFLYLTGGLTGTNATTVEVAQGLDGARRVEVNLSLGVTELNLTSAPDAQLLARGALETRRGERVRNAYQVRGDVGYLTLEAQGRPGFFGPTGAARAWELELSGRAPMDLRVDTGVGRATLDLRHLQLRSLDLNTGVGAVRVTLPAQGRFTANIDMGVGETVVRLPRSLAARIEIDRGLGEVSVPSGFTRDGNVYTSAGFAAATDRVELDIDGGVGRIRIELVE